MQDWKENKLTHDEHVWGPIRKYLDSTPLDPDVFLQWKKLFQHEMGNKNIYKHIERGRIVDNDFDGYILSKNKHLKDTLNKYITKETDAIIDLGSGWGRHSIILSHTKPHYDVVAGELSEEGRKITQIFIDKYNLKLRSFYFNWYDLSSLLSLLKDKQYKEVVIFTSNTIEQITNLDKSLFNKLLDLPIKISMVHIEPVAWQYDNLPNPFLNKNEKFYNRNLKEILDILVKEQKIKIQNIEKQYWGHNTTTTSINNTLIEWVKK